MALSGLPPVRAGRFFIFGMHDRGRTPVNAVDLQIEAGAAFGTGHHGTTVGCLSALDGLLKGACVSKGMDVGTGTGVLAIAAARTGSRVTVGTDIDPVSVRIARENAKVNRASRPVRLRQRAVASAGAGGGPYDLVFANILARPLVRLSTDIRSALRPGGVAILSGSAAVSGPTGPRRLSLTRFSAGRAAGPGRLGHARLARRIAPAGERSPFASTRFGP